MEDNEQQQQSPLNRKTKRIIPLTDEIKQVISDIKKEEELKFTSDKMVESISKTFDRELKKSLQLLSKELNSQTHLVNTFDQMFVENAINRISQRKENVNNIESMVNSSNKSNEQFMEYFSSLDNRIKQVDQNIKNIVHALKSKLEETTDSTEDEIDDKEQLE